jgi:hypothetical protein
MNEYLFVLVLLFYMLGGAMFFVTFTLSFALFFWAFRAFIRYNLEAGVPSTEFPKGIPFPIWMNAVIAFIAFLFAGLAAELIT